MFSIVAVAEGANSSELIAFFNGRWKYREVHEGQAFEASSQRMAEAKKKYIGQTLLLANELKEAKGIESRITILGYLLRGGTPSARDRVLATHLGTHADI